MIFLLVLMGCTCAPEVVQDDPLPIPAAPYLEEITFEPLFVVRAQDQTIYYVDNTNGIEEGEAVLGKIYALSREELESYVKNMESLWAHIHKLRKRIDPEYESLLE
jgi:hypothetical protein